MMHSRNIKLHLIYDPYMFKLRKIFLLPVLIFIFASCTNKISGTNDNSVDMESKADNTEFNYGDISSVSITRTAGRGGSTTMIATKDSLIFEPGRRMLEEKPGFRSKINKEDWNKLVSMIDLNVIDNAKNGEGQGHYDGPDFIVHIVTKEKDYNLLNVKDSAGAKYLIEIENFLKTLVAKGK